MVKNNGVSPAGQGNAAAFAMNDPTAFGDAVAADMRAYYDANRPRTFVEMLFGKRSTASECADNLMIGLMNIATIAYNARGANHA